jgi:anthranilate phosphoribosyltransferase
MFKDMLSQVVAGGDLSRREAARAMEAIMSGAASEAQIGALAAALKIKGETSEEITGFAQTMRDFAVKVSCGDREVFDTCGTGGDGRGTINVSTAAAFVLAGAGVPVAKHGNRGMSSPCGSADVIETLGIRIDLPAAAAAEAIASTNLCFCFAPLYHPAMKYAAKPRRDLGFRTFFNLLGPLTNPAGAKRQLVGVYQPDLTEKIADVLRQLGTKRAMVVHSLDGLDEISAAAPTKVAEVVAGEIRSYVIQPADYGLSGDAGAYKGGNAADNAGAILDVLRGERGGRRDVVLINAAAALMVADRAETLREGLALAAASIDSGAALASLEALRQFGRSYGEGLPLS